MPKSQIATRLSSSKSNRTSASSVEPQSEIPSPRHWRLSVDLELHGDHAPGAVKELGLVEKRLARVTVPPGWLTPIVLELRRLADLAERAAAAATEYGEKKGAAGTKARKGAESATARDRHAGTKGKPV